MESKSNQLVAVLIFVYQKEISELERISLKQCLQLLEAYPIKIVKPSTLELPEIEKEFPAVNFESFPDRSFSDIGAYSRLLISKSFYKRFLEYEYVLIYQLDAFVFKNDLSYWCKSGYSYIGAPWFSGFSHEDQSATWEGVGNGGFSLRNVKAHLRALNSFSYLSKPAENWRNRMMSKPAGLNLIHEVAGFVLDQTVRNNTYWLLNSFRGFEDQFWSFVVPKNFSWFTVPPPEEAMKFSMEMQPRRVFELNERELPFGCHAWWKYDLEFWKPFIESFGYRL
jgi:hypothetical protein